MTHQELVQDIKKNPERHRHQDLNELSRCCMVNGAIDMMAMQAHEGLLGSNGGVGCDVRSGPCACGAWH